jgi:hypothetical protein
MFNSLVIIDPTTNEAYWRTRRRFGTILSIADPDRELSSTVYPANILEVIAKHVNCERCENDNKPNYFSDGSDLSGNTVMLSVRMGRNLEKRKHFSQHTSPAQWDVMRGASRGAGGQYRKQAQVYISLPRAL